MDNKAKNQDSSKAPPVDVYVRMAQRMLDELNEHLEKIGEDNRSAWIRTAIRKKLREEKRELAEEKEF